MSRLDDHIHGLEQTEKELLSQINERDTDLKNLKEELRRVRACLKELMRHKPVTVVQPRPTKLIDADLDGQLYGADDWLLGILSKGPKSNYELRKLAEKDGIYILRGLFHYFHRTDVGLVGHRAGGKFKASRRYDLTSRGREYLAFCQRGERNKALSMLPKSQPIDNELLRQDILGLLFHRPKEFTLRGLRMYFLDHFRHLYQGDVGNFGPALVEQLEGLLDKGLISQTHSAEQKLLFSITERGIDHWKAITLTPSQPLIEDLALLLKEILLCMNQLASSETVAIFPEISRWLSSRFVSGKLDDKKIRHALDKLRCQGLIAATSQRTKDPHRCGDETWQEYRLTNKGKLFVRK